MKFVTDNLHMMLMENESLAGEMDGKWSNFARWPTGFQNRHPAIQI